MSWTKKAARENWEKDFSEVIYQLNTNLDELDDLIYSYRQAFADLNWAYEEIESLYSKIEDAFIKCDELLHYDE